MILLQEHLHTVYNYSGRISLQHRYVILGKVSIDYTILEQEKEFADCRSSIQERCEFYILDDALLNIC